MTQTHTWHLEPFPQATWVCQPPTSQEGLLLLSEARWGDGENIYNTPHLHPHPSSEAASSATPV